MSVKGLRVPHTDNDTKIYIVTQCREEWKRMTTKFVLSQISQGSGSNEKRWSNLHLESSDF